MALDKCKVSSGSGEERDGCRHDIHARKMESLGHFTQGIVHDIRNSLHVIISASGMIQRRTDDPLILQHLTTVNKTIERANGLIDRILGFANHSEDHLGIVDLAHSIDESIQLTRPVFPSDITLEWHRPAEPLHILGDHGQLYQVVLNLFKNAIEAIGRETRGSILITLDNVYPWAEIRVKDSGPGIAPDIIDQVCEAAFTTKADGNGFGLANVFNIVEKHGGTMQVASPAAGGAEFIILLPLLPDLHI
ncbi:sensor histidine kinase [Mariprofundus ferrooxydans]|uniref:histidine kinase n=1 Tax=Mariprofundus ferrooxydans PV-1 TaxID=314345 RepID=Q0F0L4_9PROT|nr:ATP-binding protein [Mariprofundus ferrooxydans]EAU55014.1 histidine kinase [Mariprofundus ferrooxydans PV-1]KON48444.1 histidine kinase [Mariprofundus ferrooxydans]